jgi:predicted transcriptional regulator of viral defense system
VERVGRGLYRLPDAEVSAHHALAEAAKAVPKGIVCLISALNFYEIGTQIPRQVWLAIDHRAARPRVDHPPLRIVRFSGKSLTEGIEVHEVDGVPVRVYSPAKTVVDCFRYRNKIGLDVALEALREARRGRKCTIDDLWRYAKAGRAASVIRHYLEATA